MNEQKWLSDLFCAIDQKDTTSFTSFLAEDCVFRFGNMPSVQGRTNIREFVNGFFDSIKSLSHEIDEQWDIPAGKVCHGMVSYTRMNDSVLTVPFSNIFKLNDGGIDEYLIFADTSRLYE